MMLNRLLPLYLVVLLSSIDNWTQATLTFTCHPEEDNLVSIYYVGEAKAIFARHADASICLFTEFSENATYVLSATLEASGDSCLMDKGTGKTYTVEIYIRMENAHMDHINDIRRRVTCIYDKLLGSDIDTESGDTINPPKLVTKQNGPKAEAVVIDVKLVDNNGDDITGSMTLGQLVKIRAVMTEHPNYAGFVVTNCLVETEDKSANYTIIARGCGTGTPISKDYGFTITGLVAESPTFKLFRLVRGQGIAFSCQTNMCDTNCDGFTCLTDKRIL